MKLFPWFTRIEWSFPGAAGSLDCLFTDGSFQLHPLIPVGLRRPDDNLGIALMEFLELYGRLLHYEKVGSPLESIVKVPKSVELMRRCCPKLMFPMGITIKWIVASLTKVDPVCYRSKTLKAFQRSCLSLLFHFVSPSSLQTRFQYPHGCCPGNRPASRWNRQRTSGYNRTDGSLLASLIVIPEKFWNIRSILNEQLYHVKSNINKLIIL